MDALDTLHLAFHGWGGEEQKTAIAELWTRAEEHVRQIDWMVRDYDASFFEMTIRYLGGLLSIHQLSGERMYLLKAEELGERLALAFDSPSGVPYSIVNLRSGKTRNPQWNGGNSILSELGSVQLEFGLLSRLSGNPAFGAAARAVLSHLHKLPPSPGVPAGLFPVAIDPRTGRASSDAVSFGGLGDSFYEYLLKQYLLSGRTDLVARDMYLAAVDALKAHLLAVSNDGRKYVSEMKAGARTGGFDHLVCYVPGMLALGALSIPGRQPDLDLAVDLLDTCISLYLDQPTGLGPERVQWHPVDSSGPAYAISSPRYLLRPETLESIFILYRATHNDRYREIGWQIFQSLQKYCRTPAAFSGLRDVTALHSPLDNSMQSFFMAETLKYLFLLFSPDDLLPLDQYVFNTEAHPFQI